MTETKPAPDALARIREGVLVATEKLRVGTASGTTELRHAGELVPEAAHWDRLFVELTKGRVLRLSPEACVAVVREAIAADPGLLAGIVKTVIRAELADAARVQPKAEDKSSKSGGK